MDIEKHYRENWERLVNRYTRLVGYHNSEDLIQEFYLNLLEYGEYVKTEEQANIVLYRTVKNFVRKEVYLKGATYVSKDEKIWYDEIDRYENKLLDKGASSFQK